MADTDAEPPVTHVISFDYDAADRCTLIARINDVRFHIAVDPKRLESNNKEDTEIGYEYSRRLQALREQAAREDSTTQSADSGIEVTDTKSQSEESREEEADRPQERTETEDEGLPDTFEKDAETSLQNWILSCMGDEVARLAPNHDEHPQYSLHDWYNTPAFFFDLAIEDSQLSPVETRETPQLRKTLDDLLPSLPMPKYITNLPDLPWLDPTNIKVVSTSTHSPACPIHPALVSTNFPNTKKNQTFFFKPVDPTQPSPTKREILLLHKIHSLNLSSRINVPTLHALVRSSSKTSIMGLLLTPIPEPLTPLTTYLAPSTLPLPKRESYAEQIHDIISVLHANKIVFGDAKADNFLIDKDGKLWIIDFGGSYTEGWVEEEDMETEKGDWQGVERVRGALRGEDLDLDKDKDGEGNGDGGEQGVKVVERCGCGSCSEGKQKGQQKGQQKGKRKRAEDDENGEKGREKARKRSN
jgi:hypothetical protein